jgi:3-methyl-2-oxobutanoate hydroxymethyltransferase
METSSARRRIAPDAIRRRKGGSSPITLLSAYDYPVARCADLAGIDIVFVSDAFALVGLGRNSTTSVTVDEVSYHTKAVRAGAGACLVLSSLPFLSYSSPDRALASAGRLIKEAEADAVELEGGDELAPIVELLHQNGVAVVAHIGLTKQLIARSGSHRTQGKTADSAVEIIKQAIALEASGAFALILECVPHRLAEIVTSVVKIPTIGIGAGPHCDGQGLVSQDMLGLYDKFCPRFVKQYRQLAHEMTNAFSTFRAEVADKRFPGPEHTTIADAAWSDELRLQLGIDTGECSADIKEKILSIQSRTSKRSEQ